MCHASRFCNSCRRPAKTNKNCLIYGKVERKSCLGASPPSALLISSAVAVVVVVLWTWLGPWHYYIYCHRIFRMWWCAYRRHPESGGITVIGKSSIEKLFARPYDSMICAGILPASVLPRNTVLMFVFVAAPPQFAQRNRNEILLIAAHRTGSLWATEIHIQSTHIYI